MNVMYTCDDNYIWLMGISLISLYENNKHIDNLEVYLLGENISERSKKKLATIAVQYNRKVEIIDVPKFDIPSSLISARWPISAFTRLFSAILLPADIEKILYLDCDTIINGDVSELEKIKFDGNIAMGVKDCISGTYKRNIGLNNEDLYVNAGVLLFDVNALRKINVSNVIEKYMREYRKLINYADQDILNGIFNGKIGELDPKFNVMTIDVVYSYEEILKLRRPSNYCKKIEFEHAKNDPIIIHYTTNMTVVRPWYKNTDHPLAQRFREYLKISEWRDKSLDEQIFSSKRDKIIKVIMKLPKNVAYSILGIVHAELKPRYIRMRAR